MVINFQTPNYLINCFQAIGYKTAHSKCTSLANFSKAFAISGCFFSFGSVLKMLSASARAILINFRLLRFSMAMSESPDGDFPSSCPGPRSFKSISESSNQSLLFSIACMRSSAVLVAESVKRKQYDWCSPRPTRPRNW